MNYLSITFVGLILISLIVYYLVPQKVRCYVLLLTSIAFYLSFSFKYSIFITISIILSYGCAIALPRMQQASKKRLLIITIFVLVATLIFINFYDWSASLGNLVFTHFNVSFQFPLFYLLMPIGISFYTLQMIGYLVDIYRGKIIPQSNIFKYALFISYFPNIIQGPIHRYDQLAKQLYTGHAFHYDNVTLSLQLAGWGLMKKMVIADSLALYVNTVFEKANMFGGFILYVGAVAYAIQLYMDFSGCVDICRGVSGMFGVQIIKNFKQPYLATSIKDFWSRWHISLSSWLKDYVYIPLGGNRKGQFRKYINLLITFFVSGLWHGCGFTFIIWGLLHGIYQIFGDVFQSFRTKIKKVLKIEEHSTSERIYQIFITFHLVTFAWIFFRSSGVMNAYQYIYNMVTVWNPWVLFDGSLFTLGISLPRLSVVMILLFIVFMSEVMQNNKHVQFRRYIQKMHIVIRWCIYIALILVIVIYGVYGPGYDASNFIYGGF